MDCHKAQDLLSEYVDGVLGDNEASMVKRHLDDCADCRSTYESMVKVIGHMNHMESIDEPADFLNKVNARLERESTWKEFVHRLFFPLKIKLPLELAAAAVVIALIIHFSGIGDAPPLYEITMSTKARVEKEKRGKKGPSGEKGRGEGIDTIKVSDIQGVVNILGGRIIQPEHLDDTDLPAGMTIEIRADRYMALLQELKRLGIIRKSPPIAPDESGKTIRVRIDFQ